MFVSLHRADGAAEKCGEPIEGRRISGDARGGFEPTNARQRGGLNQSKREHLLDEVIGELDGLVRRSVGVPAVGQQVVEANLQPVAAS
jgi:hypothetical protein